MNPSEIDRYLDIAIGLAVANVRDPDAPGGPFGAALLTADGGIYFGTNGVTRVPDPSAHAEVTAIREAARQLRTHDLAGSVLFTSCAPCPMCLSTALWARVATIYYAATPEQAAAAGFDDELFYEQLQGPRLAGERFSFLRDLEMISVPRPTQLEPFDTWVSLTNRTDY